MMMNIHDKICKELHERRELGLKKYGVSVDDAGLTDREWLQHLKEELMDGVVYIQAFLDREQK